MKLIFALNVSTYAQTARRSTPHCIAQPSSLMKNLYIFSVLLNHIIWINLNLNKWCSATPPYRMALFLILSNPKAVKMVQAASVFIEVDLKRFFESHPILRLSCLSLFLVLCSHGFEHLNQGLPGEKLSSPVKSLQLTWCHSWWSLGRPFSLWHQPPYPACPPAPGWPKIKV